MNLDCFWDLRWFFNLVPHQLHMICLLLGCFACFMPCSTENYRYAKEDSHLGALKYVCHRLEYQCMMEYYFKKSSKCSLCSLNETWNVFGWFMQFSRIISRCVNVHVHNLWVNSCNWTQISKIQMSSSALIILTSTYNQWRTTKLEYDSLHPKIDF